MSKITLYGPREVPFVVKVERALRLKKLEYELVEPASPDDYRRWNPETGLLPVAQIGSERIADSTRILERLDVLFPEPSLLSSDPKLAEAQRRLEDWCDETFFFYWLRWQRIFAAEAARPPRKFGLVTWLWELATSRSSRPRGRGRDGLPPEADDLVDELGRRCDDLVNMLSGRPFFYSDRPSMADFAVYAMLHSMRRGGLPRGPLLLAERPALVEFMERVEEATGR
jgi:glutathione S-transferase